MLIPIITPVVKMERKTTVSLHTLGCKLNQAETESLSRQFSAAGYGIIENNADICVVNTCTVTHIADRKSRHLIRLLRKSNPQAFIIVTGCCAETSSADLFRAGASMLVNNKQKEHIVELLQKQQLKIPDIQSDNHIAAHTQRVRSFIKIQHGCTSNCTYCIVPSVRGCEYSLSPDMILKEVQDRTANGYKEVVLTGTKAGAYEYNGVFLKSLLQRILAETDIQRLHLSSLQPEELTQELLALWQNKRLCPHFHLALQSGSDSVLRQMRRHYTVNQYLESVTMIRKLLPDASITTDIMVGFPGESDTEFEESYHLCRDIGFSAIHVFMYSPRPDTPAVSMDKQIDAHIKKQRSLKMLALAYESAIKYQKKFLGQVHDVLWERETEQKLFNGLTDNYLRVFTHSTLPLSNRLLPVRLVSSTRQGIRGELL
ncbi:MAG TPA: tRNA (N(6)-L-threonylcarbamoyladenosine(37)-C(2))-methylthiotransferase MtaB [Dehalococcoidia bacterium]|nr:tRNA (N(6)-L-threonylcarbamoyladenosine(37)-C(2))-methylthiotransferase MtaB [Dehalococcoidia bacterium]